MEKDSLKLKLRHKNIMRIFECGTNNFMRNGEIVEKRNFVVAEYCPNGDLNNLILNAGKLPEEIALFLFSKILVGVEYLHDK